MMSDVNPNLGPQFSDFRQQYAPQPGPPPAAGTFRKAPPPRGIQLTHIPDAKFGSGAAMGQDAILLAYLRGGRSPGGEDQSDGVSTLPAEFLRSAGQAIQQAYGVDPFAEPLIRADFGTALGDIATMMEP
jgi:hypothetical protein